MSLLQTLVVQLRDVFKEGVDPGDVAEEGGGVARDEEEGFWRGTLERFWW